MPVPKPRDPDATRARLTEWLVHRLPDARNVAITNFRAPSQGFSNETLYFDASWEDAGGEHAESLVLRIQPAGGHQLFFEGNLRDVLFQHRVMEAIAPHGVPVAPLRWAEADPSVLGGPFFIMGRVEGSAPPDMPGYNAEGFLVAMPPERRRVLWTNALAAMTRIHKVDWRKGLEFLSQPSRGEPGLGQFLQMVEEWYAWVDRGRSIPILKEAMEFVRANRPANPGPVSIVWGDSRMGNMIFNDQQEVVAVTDWEAAALGTPEVDLGWWLFMDSWQSDGYNLRRLEGLPGRDETIAEYERLSGYRPRDMHFFEVLGGLRMTMVTIRSMDQYADWGMPMDPASLVNNGSSYALAPLVGLPRPPLFD